MRCGMKYKLLATTDTPHCCDFCGFNELKKTYICEDLDGNKVYFGSSCVTKALKLSIKDVEKEIKYKNECKRQSYIDLVKFVDSELEKTAEAINLQKFFDLGYNYGHPDETDKPISSLPEYELYVLKKVEMYKENKIGIYND
jgi:hypothetical protein